ncbi:hypothetical protein [Vallitalea maricola]|uniref:hypothetical protein n=1 Tax=Vallitalea maricola TaxID=3074433 RepID=UPI0030DBD414
MSKLEDEIFRLGDFINSSGQAYSQAEDSISKLVGLDNLTINSSISSNKNPNSPMGNYPFKGFDFSSSIKHLLDFFRKIGQATIDFFVLDDPRNALKTADSFIDIKPCTGIAYRAGLPSYNNILIETGDFNITGNDPLINKYEGKYTAVDKTNDFESVFSNVWNNIWSHIKKIGEFFAPVYENLKDLAIKHQEAMKELPNDIATLDYEPWMSTLNTFPDSEDKYRCAISNIPSYKEAGHAMVLGWMATDPSSRGINPKYYPQLLATLMVYKDKEALTLEQIDAKYLEIYNRNEEAIRRAEEKEKEENSSVLDTALEWTHTVLDIVGWVPFCGDVCDLINAGLYLLQNDFVNVALSCIAFIPAIGQGIKGILKKIFNAGDDAKAIAKILSKIDNPKAIIEKIKKACTHMISWLKNLPNSIDNLLDSPFISKMLGGAKKGVSKIIDGISSMLDKFTTKIQDTIDNVVEKIEKKFTKNLDDIINPKVVDEIISTEKGLRPDPSTYMPKQYIDKHLAKFDDGVTKITWQAPNRPVGPPSGTFVMPKSVADDLIAKSGGDVSKLEQLLSLEPGTLGNTPVRVDIDNPTGLRMPSGNEFGANDQWIPGGFTGGGIPEATIDQVPLDKITVTNLFN